ncbi:Clan CA, family C1, cathepsin L-like cysteine peptidase [Tritrichomonas foetus]|uniref:Clan CA, family C1, cathepsin L-like cysteine peptidase n=1 Tax=Tritrichomonas foetus TaxID=1144522 RepID=A0A1J4JYB1_9EUKA|nr:Clan CA, family C1, cathepsin L-like cysteine peptidase [Tritrichomonas foetus]|eukprot:OHT02261.1 Clan CA, family C1, cathepsin L-like cysteine peptidase [Tritrichomonas foetus]
MLSLFLSFISCSKYLQHEEKSFVGWMRNTNQIFTGDEYQLRFGIYVSNARYVQEHNSKIDKTFTLSLNKFAALTPAEYRSMLGLRPSIRNLPQSKSTSTSTSNFKDDIEYLDWREKGVVNPIKNQQQCGSCWAFSAVQAIESMNAIQSGKLERYSEQSLVDCVLTCFGCSGGLVDLAFDYIISREHGKMNLESEYPYVGVEESCKFNNMQKVGSISNYKGINSGSEDDLADKLQKEGPIAVGIDASATSFTLYSGGIYDEKGCSPSNLDHGVGCVGFGKEGDIKYWIVRNSWGEEWGEKGYIRMIWKNNQCGIASMAYYPIY